MSADLTAMPAWNLEHDASALARYVFRDAVTSYLRLPGQSDVSAIGRLEKVYAAFYEHPIGYSYEHPDSTANEQIIRPPAQVLGLPGHGTCLDIAVMFAAACLIAGLDSVVVVLDRAARSTRNRHALVAVHVGHGAGTGALDPVLNAAPSELSDGIWLDLDGPPGQWAIVDVVGVAAADEEHLSTDMQGLGVGFATALVNGSDYLTSEDWQWKVGVNISRLWDPDLLIPLPSPAPAEHPIGPKQYAGMVALPPRRLPVTNDSDQRLVGRDLAIKSLHSALDAGANDVAVVYGLGGVGKSALALEYAYQYGKQYSLVWWVDAENIRRGYDQLGEHLRIHAEPDKLEDAINRHLRQRVNWLCILDNAADPAVLHDFRQGIDTGQVIATSRAEDLDWPNPLRLEKIEPSAAKHWLLTAADAHGDQTEEAAADTLVAELDGLALALSMATAYIQANQVTIAEYRDLYNSYANLMLGSERYLPAADRDSERTVYTTWNVSVNKLKQQNKDLAVRLLETICFYAPNRIPLRIFHGEPFGANQVEVDNAVMDLRAFSLVERDGKYISLHRLVQDVTRHNLKTVEPASP